MAPKEGYVDINIKVNNQLITDKKYKMEVGCSFENNGAIYRINNDGLLSVFDKDKQCWLSGIKEITMKNYQLDVFEAVANNNKEKVNNKVSKDIILSKADIDSAMDMYKKNQLNNDLKEFLQGNGHTKVQYCTDKTKAYTNSHGFSTEAAPKDSKLNKIKSYCAELIFKWGTAKDAKKLSKQVHKDVQQKTAAGNKTQSTSVAKPTVKPAVKPATPPAAKQTAKTVSKPTAKTSSQTAAKPKKSVPNAVKQEIASKTSKSKKPVAQAKRMIQVKKKKVYDVKTLKPSNDAKNLIKKREQLVLYTYDDLDKSYPRKFIKKGDKYKGTLTYGYGHTKGVKPGVKISKAKAEKLLDQDMKAAVNAVKKHVKVKISQNQFDALVSFVFNVGEPAFAKSTLLKMINKNKFNAAAAEFMAWRFSNGRVCGGLVDRRTDEQKVFIG